MSEPNNFMDKESVKQSLAALRDKVHLSSEMIVAYASHVLSPEGQSKVEAHLAACNDCNELLIIAKDSLADERNPKLDELEAEVPPISVKLEAKMQLVCLVNSKKDDLTEQVARLLLPEDMQFAIRLAIDAMRDSEKSRPKERNVRSGGLRAAAFASGNDEDVKETMIIVGRVLDFVDSLCDNLIRHCVNQKCIVMELEPAISTSIDLLALEKQSPLFTRLKDLLNDVFPATEDGKDATT